MEVDHDWVACVEQEINKSLLKPKQRGNGKALKVTLGLGVNI